MMARYPLSFILSAGMLLTLVLLAVFAPFVAPYSPSDVVSAPFAPPSTNHLLGADALGRDLLSRTAYGLRYTIGIASFVTMVACFLGVTLAITAAVRKGWVDAIIGRSVDAVMAIPQIIFALIVLAVAGVSLTTLVCTMIVLETTLFFRILRAAAGDIAAMDFIEVARLRGEKMPWYIFREILPNLAPTLIAEFGLRFAFAALFISALSFLGVGIQPPDADLGGLVRENALAISIGRGAPLVPAVAIAAIAISTNGIVDWLVRKYSIRAELAQ
ncbi:ABC transporter permease [Rhodophyticola sp. CCM32]|uniref:ABC transporter permease n=1 Tax=Rhodophyticola sp. CCM32 TaxID=2916397 RepID=UPI00107F7409|nr:ABC transporter permease [Rhodophyticola sp. CCM32]QBY00886.1 ABC transporter permease [Rhodophyticola sp. CCM32]